ncbi:MAG: hypothetical protein SGILL_002237 [Bacillariaceae sp.]
MPSSSKSSKKDRRSSRRTEEQEENVDQTSAARRTSSGRSSYTSTSSAASSSRRRPSVLDGETLTHEDEIERIREMRARRLRQERGETEGGGDDIAATGSSVSDRLRQRRSELSSGQRRSGDTGSDPSRIRSSPALSRRELEEAGLVRKDRRSSRFSSISGDDNLDDATSASSYAKARRERLERARAQAHQSSDDDEILEVSADPRATTRLDIEARMAARRSSRKASDSLDAVGSTTQMSLEELRSRREASSRLGGAHSDDEGPSSPARERIRDRATRGVPRRTKSADEDLMAMRTSNRSLDSSQGRPDEDENYADSLDEREARRLERQNRPTRMSTTDLSTRLKERREARAAEREAREREKMESSDITNIRLRTRRLSLAGRQKRGDRSGSIEDLEMTDDETDDDSMAGWSIRLCVVSAMDLPLSVVPNTPLCPVLKLGLVNLPDDSSMQNEETATRAVIRMLGDESVEAVRSAQVCTTTQKILGKRDNGTVDFHQEYRWDRVKQPANVGLCVELCARAVRTPTNMMESPPALSLNQAFSIQEQSSSGANAEESISAPSLDRTPSGSEDAGGFRSFWNKNNKRQAELEAAEAAAAVARMLVEEGDQQQEGGPPSSGTVKTSSTPQSDYEVSLRSHAKEESIQDLTEDIRLGSLVIPLTKLPLDKAMTKNETVRLEQWYELETTDESTGVSQRRKKPSVLLEISFSAPEIFDDSEDELEEEGLFGEGNESAKSLASANESFARRSKRKLLGEQPKDREKPKEEAKVEDPFLGPGVIDFVAVVGCRDIGKQKHDDGSKGWVKSSPESVLLEQFPPESDFHVKNGRNVLLPEMVQWFCFPEGTRLWRGTSPPSHSDLNLKRFSAASPSNVASSIAAFDACLNCTTSFSWFAIATNSDEYGSSLVKTYGAVIRFYAPAPTGIDPTQDDFAQAVLGNVTKSSASGPAKRLWVPMGICLTSNMPIVGIMEALLLRLCEELSAISGSLDPTKLEEIHKTVANMILNFQKPIAGAVNCSVPFLDGDRFLFSLPPPTGLPPVPHGRSVISVCRLLGAEGLNYVISAVLTECKVLLHSQEIADIAMVAEVITALTYPFVWSLPYIPILPIGMLEFVEAPLSYILGVPTCNLKQLDPRALDDVVVIDLNNGFSSIDHFQSRRQAKNGGNKHPTPLPASVATNLSKAVYKLLRLEEEMEEEFGSADLGEQILPRLESESLAEREFRVAVAIEICGLLRGYQDCVGTVFNRDKFLKIAPALYEERRESRGVGPGLVSRNAPSSQNKVLSARSKRFLSLLVNGQNFQQLVESLESPEASFFHEIMELIDDSGSDTKPHIAMRTSSGDNATSKAERNILDLMKSLQRAEDKIPTYRVEKGGRLNGEHGEDEDGEFYFDGDFDDFDDFDVDGEFLSTEDRNAPSFTTDILSPIDCESATVDSAEPGKQSLSMEYLTKLEETPWEYQSLFKIAIGGSESEASIVDIHEKVKLRDAIGERRFRAWRASQDQKPGVDADLAFLPESGRGSALNLTTLVTSAKNDKSENASLSSGRNSLRTSTLSPEQQKVADAKSRDIIRRCLDKAQGDDGSSTDLSEIFMENSRNLLAEAEKALRNPSAQLFLLKILAQRSRLESQKVRSIRRQSVVANSVSRLEPVAFNCLVGLSCAMLDSCMEFKEFEPAYRLLTNTAGFVMVIDNSNDESESGEAHDRTIVTMTSRVGLHPIFADLGVWETVMKLHLRDRKSAKKSEGTTRLGQDEESGDEEDDEVEYEAAVATLYEMVGYGIPGEELSRFAMRASEENGWFCDDRGRQLLMLARRISVRRDQADVGGTGEASDINMVRKGPEGTESTGAASENAFFEENYGYTWKEVGWCHPAAPSSRTLAGGSIHSLSSHTASSDDLLRRSPVTSLASFGTSLVVSGGLDGGVFLAHSIKGQLPDGDDDVGTAEVRGIHLDWGSASRAGTGTSSDGEYGVGAVSCLAAAYGSGHHSHNIAATKDVGGGSNELEFADSMEGSRIVAGTTAGDLRVWSVKDVYSAILLAKNNDDSARTRLKFSLRGRALSGHRGGVTCIDVPSQVYRPDSLITGGADGLIKLWSLRAPTSSRRSVADSEASGSKTGQQRGRGGDALITLSDHVGRILCIQTAWHGDHLLSGGADRTIRVWDLQSGGGKSLHTLFGHFGWVTNVQYWGPNTIVSASTDRSMALWDARVRSSPLFVLRHHHSPISDLLVGSRTDPFMVSSGTDGSIAAWDFRMLSDTDGRDADHAGNSNNDASRACTVVREPSAAMFHSPTAVGPTLLARSVKSPMNAFLSVGSDAILREWNLASAEMLDESPTGHCDAITSFESFASNGGFGSAAPPAENHDAANHKGTLTSSLDGTIRIRKLVRNTKAED